MMDPDARELLSILASGGDVQPLIDHGLTYGQILRILREVEDAGLVGRDSEDRLLLTEKGRTILLSTREGLRRPPARTAIRPLSRAQTDKMNPDDIYLPPEGVILKETKQ